MQRIQTHKSPPCSENVIKWWIMMLSRPTSTQRCLRCIAWTQAYLRRKLDLTHGPLSLAVTCYIAYSHVRIVPVKWPSVFCSLRLNSHFFWLLPLARLPCNVASVKNSVRHGLLVAFWILIIWTITLSFLVLTSTENCSTLGTVTQD